MSGTHSLVWPFKFQLCRAPSPAAPPPWVPVWVIGSINYEYNVYYFDFAFGDLPPGQLSGEDATVSMSIDGVAASAVGALRDGATGPVYGLYSGGGAGWIAFVGDDQYHAVAWSAGSSGDYSWGAGSFSCKLEDWGTWVDVVPYLEPA